MIFLENLSAADRPVFFGHDVPERVWILAAMKFGFSTLSVVKGELTLRIVSNRSDRWSVRQRFEVKEPSFWGTYIERRKIR
jgi:hypothetical protein